MKNIDKNISNSSIISNENIVDAIKNKKLEIEMPKVDIDGVEYFDEEDECYGETFDNLIDINIDNLVDCKYDKNRFQDGLNNISYLAGQITGLATVGISPAIALQILTEQQGTLDVLKSNEKVTKITAKANIKSAKYINVNQQQQTI